MYRTLFISLCGLIGLSSINAQSDGLARGATQMPYHRYEADEGNYGGGANLYTNPEFDQLQTSSEASEYRYVGLPSNGSFVEWTLAHNANGVTLRFTIPDGPGGEGLEGSLDMYVNDQLVKTIDLTSYWAWQYFPNSEPENEPGPRPRMRFDEVHFLTDQSLSPGDVVKLQKNNGDALEYGVDFIEIEQVAPPKPQPAGYVSVTDFGATPNDGSDDLPAFQAALTAAGQRGTGVYIPVGQFTLDNKLLFETDNIGFKGAGMWHTQLYFSREGIFTGGILARATNVELSDFYLNTINDQRFLNNAYVIYKAFMGTYGSDSSIHDVWATHFEVGAWIAGYDPPYPIDITQNLEFRNNRIRNNYADGINLCQGTSNSRVFQNNFRSNGDDAMAVWPDNSQNAPVAVNNIFSYNTVENNYRAGGAAIFGGDGHQVHHCIIKDGLAGSGLRVTTDFPGYHFENTQAIRFFENTLINCGTSTDLFGPERGAIEINATGHPIKNVFFENIDIINAQRHGVQIGSNNTVDLQFDNISINGTGLDPITDAKYTIPTEGAAIMTHARQDTSTFNNLKLENIERDPPFLKGYESYNLVFENTTVPLQGISLPVDEINLTNGETETLTVEFSPANANNKRVTWTSSNEDIAIYDETAGGVVATGIGTAEITVTSEEGGFTASVTVSVEAAVTIEATQAEASESGSPGQFEISIPALSNAITVAYEISGSASASDYSASPALSGSVNLSPGNLSQTITINPIDDDAFEGNETLQLTLQPGDGYQLGTVASATITIADNEDPECTAPTIAEANGNPTIGGGIDGAWSIAPSKSIENTTIGGTPGDFSGNWKALYDSNTLYVLVNVSDATLTNDSGGEWWNDDTVEIFIDGNNSKGTSYDGQNDFQLGFRWNDDTVHAGGNSVQNVSGIDFDMSATANGYVLEVAIPWSTIGISPASGDQIGFDVAVDDDDNGDARDSQVASLAISDAGWTNPSVFGSVYLTRCDGGDTPTNRAPLANAGTDRSVESTVTSVSLEGNGSDADGDSLTYSWTQTSGQAATIASATSVSTQVSGLSPDNSYTFTLTVSDGELSANDTVTVRVAAEDNGGGDDGGDDSSGEGFTIQNVWNNSYLQDGGATVTYADTPSGDTFYWTLEEVQNGRVEIKNVATGDYMHVENLTGSVQCTSREPVWDSAKWIVSETGDGSVRIMNVWQNYQYVHVENLTGSAQFGQIFPSWASAKWELSENGVAAAQFVATAAAAIKIYPNPARSSFTLQYDNPVEAAQTSYSIYNVVGQPIKTGAIQSNKTSVSVDGMPPGVYVVKIDSDGASKGIQLIVE